MCGRNPERRRRLIAAIDSIKNLWPESYRTVWNARVKDQLEDRLHALVIRGKLYLKTTQHEIAADWIAAYKKYVVLVPTSGRRLSYNAEAPREAGSPSDQEDLNSSTHQAWTRSG